MIVHGLTKETSAQRVLEDIQKKFLAHEINREAVKKSNSQEVDSPVGPVHESSRLFVVASSHLSLPSIR